MLGGAMAYTDVSEHQWMIADRVRTGAYDEAIRALVRPGDVVLDFGCGLGILAMLAARAGARKVYAVDRLPIVRLARAIARRNGLDDIDFVFAPEGAFSLPEKVDVIVSEWMGHFAVHEGVLGSLCAARDDHLKQSGRMIPERVIARAALVRDRALHERRSFLRTPRYGLDFSEAAGWVAAEVRSERLTPDQVLWPDTVVATLDMVSVPGTPRVMEGTLVTDEGAEVFGIAGWFEVELGGGLRFDTGPRAPETHWAPLYFPFSEPWRVGANRPVRLRFWPVQLDAVHMGWRWRAEEGESSREGDDMSWRAYLKRPLAPGILG